MKNSPEAKLETLENHEMYTTNHTNNTNPQTRSPFPSFAQSSGAVEYIDCFSAKR